MERSLFDDCLGVDPIVRYARKERLLIVKNSAGQAICNVGWFSGCTNALLTAKTTLDITPGHTSIGSDTRGFLVSPRV